MFHLTLFNLSWATLVTLTSGRATLLPMAV